MKRFTKYLIFLGFKIIGFILFYGLFFISYAAFVGDIINKTTNPEYAYYLKWSVPLVPSIGVFILIGWILWSAFYEPKCHHCNKRLFDEQQAKPGVEHE